MSSQIATLAGRGLSPVVKLTTWVGKGKPVTAKGVLRPSEVPAVAAVLGVQVPAKVRTAADVTPIHWPWVAAEGAGLIEVGAAKAVACEVDADPAQLWLKGLDAVLLTESRDRNRRGAFTLCRAVLTAKAEEAADLVPAVREILDEYEDSDTVAEAFRRDAELPVDDAIALLTSFGALDEKARLTPLGHWAHERFEARAPESVTPDLPVHELLTRLAPLPEDEAWRQALRWFGERRPVFGAAQLLYAAEFAAPVERVAAVDVVAGFGAEALPAWRNSLRYKNLRPHAMAALADWGEGRGVDEAQRRWLVTEYALSARAKRGIEDAYHYVRDSGGLAVLEASDHPGAEALHRALTRANVRVRVYQLKIVRTPAVWRRVLVPGGATLACLHDIVQLLLGHDDEELHAFDVDGVRYSDPFYGLTEHRDEHEVRLSTVFPRPGGNVGYAYDLGEPWEYQITCEKVLDADALLSYPACVAGKGAGFDGEGLNRALAGLGMPQPG